MARDGHKMQGCGSPQAGFTLAEIMITVAIIALLISIVVPSQIRSRRRSQATTVLTDLRLIDSAVDQYALETGRPKGFVVPYDDWQKFLKTDSRLQSTGKDILGNLYGDQVVEDLPMIPRSTWDALSDVVPPDFWSPYKPEGGF